MIFAKQKIKSFMRIMKPRKEVPAESDVVHLNCEKINAKMDGIKITKYYLD